QKQERDDECPRTAESRHSIGDPFAERRLGLDDFVWVPRGAPANELLCSMKALAKYGQHVHGRMRLLLDKRQDVVPIQFDADRLLECDGGGLVSGSIEHRREAQKIAACRLLEHDVLLIRVD